MRMQHMIGLASLMVVLAGVAVSAADFAAERAHNWHQWRGPEANGLAPLADPPVAWSQTRNVKWKVEIPGRGKSTPIIWGDRVFVTTAVDTRKVVEGAIPPDQQPQRQFGIKFPNTLYRFVVLCLDRQTGKLLWEQTAVEELPHEGHHGDNSFASASPTTDGEFLYVSFGSRGVYCYSLDGEFRWKRKLNDVSTRLSFGEGSSPVVHGDTVLLNRDNETDSRLLALDARTGESRWEAPRDESSAWATPLVVRHNGRVQVITNASRKVRSYDLANGDVIWQCGGQVGNVTPSPVLLGEDVICMSGYRGSIAMSLPLAAQGDITDSGQIAWRYDRDTPYVPSPLLYDDLLYFNKSNNGVLTVLDAKTGKPVLEATRMEGISNIYASPVAAAGRVYFVARDGTTLVLKHGPMLDVLATNRLDDSVDASPAIAGRQLFLRGQSHLYCFENQQ
uniref:Pyrrolo-quinoline quinone repeat domain-containing protein n=1 Tax=Schlesneria paludicola TaxID=360056 RepID=A0A7C2P8Y6_9PLAN